MLQTAAERRASAAEGQRAEAAAPASPTSVPSPPPRIAEELRCRAALALAHPLVLAKYVRPLPCRRAAMIRAGRGLSRALLRSHCQKRKATRANAAGARSRRARRSELSHVRAAKRNFTPVGDEALLSVKLAILRVNRSDPVAKRNFTPVGDEALFLVKFVFLRVKRSDPVDPTGRRVDPSGRPSRPESTRAVYSIYTYTYIRPDRSTGSTAIAPRRPKRSADVCQHLDTTL